jgi:hypothetical protein
MRTPWVHLHQQHLLLLQHRQHHLRHDLLGQLLRSVQESSTSSWCWRMKAWKTEGWPNRRPCAWASRTGPRWCLGLHPRIHDARGGAPFAGRPSPMGCTPFIIRVLYLWQLEFCFTSSFSYTRTRTNMCCPLWFRTPPSSDIKNARLRFLFVLRLRTGIDLCDQADLAPARSVTIGSWFSDCIGASSLACRSRIVRVTSHQIEVISTHWKIGHFASIKWYQLSRLIAEFYLVSSPSYSPKKPTKIFF